MKVLISVDIEGVAGVVSAGEHTSREDKDYERFRRLMTQEANAAIEGALAGGATEVLVNDSHGPMTNLITEDLNPGADLITGRPKPFAMMQGMDAGIDRVMFVGYHAAAGTTAGVLAHTISGRVVYNDFFNGKRLGETGLNAALAGAFGAPVVLVCGDKAVTVEARELLGAIETVAVKEGVTWTSARSLHPETARKRIREAAQRAMSVRVAPLVIPAPVVVRLEFMNPVQADLASMMPGTRRVDGRAVEYTAANMIDAFMGNRAMIALASGA
jgi:D-amino peptidase